MNPSKKSISIIVPAYNEEVIIRNSANKIIGVLNDLQKSRLIDNYELIFVDDGSSDKTWLYIKNLHNQNKKIKGLSFSRNFGMRAAYAAGLTKAKGDYIVMIDCDLQDPPELIKKMLIKLNATKSDVVYGKRIKRNEIFYKQFAFNLFHFIYHNISNINAPQNVGNFSIMTRRAVDAFLSYKEKDGYIPGLRYLMGFKQTYITYQRLDRKHGSGKMSIQKLMRLAFDAIFSFTDLPLKFCLYIGLLGTLVSFAAGSYALITRLLNYNVTVGWSSTLLSIYFFGSIQLIFLGIIGQYIFKIYTEVLNRPKYFVSEEIT